MLPVSIQSIFTDLKGPLSIEELEMGESIAWLEQVIFRELNQYLIEFENNKKLMDPNLSLLTAELQFALDIIRSTRTIEEEKRVYKILKCLGTLPQ